MTGKTLPEIRIKTAVAGQNSGAYWTLHASNGQRMATSRHYKNSSGAIQGAQRACQLFGNVKLIDQWDRPIPEISS